MLKFGIRTLENVFQEIKFVNEIQKIMKLQKMENRTLKTKFGK